MRTFTAALLATALIASSASAAPLAPGKPAGVKQAELAGNGILILLGIAVVAGGIALVASTGNNTSTVAASTTGTAP